MSLPDLSPLVMSAARRVQGALCALDPAVAQGILAQDMLGLRRACGLPAPRGDSGQSLRGTARFLRFRDGWAVLNLARHSDLDLLPALTRGAVDCAAGLEGWARDSDLAAAGQDALDLGLAFAAVSAGPAGPCPPFSYRPSGVALAAGPVVNLSGLWAGPLAGRILADAGLDVSVLHAASRPLSVQPDWARRFTGVLRQGQRERVVPHLADPVTRGLLDGAQVIITASRADSLARAGIVPRPDQLWLRITAYGADGAQARRIGYGDDVGAAAGGALWAQDGTPRFQGDAFPDPVTGMIGAFAVLTARQRGEGGVLDASLFQAATWALHGGGALS